MWTRDQNYRERAYDFRPRRRDPRSFRGSTPYDRGFRGDYWWMGEQAMMRQHGRPAYDAQFRRFDQTHHPQYSPVGGMYPAMGGRAMQRPPRPLRDPRRFSEWTRWF